jgi:hypothetical protein
MKRNPITFMLAEDRLRRNQFLAQVVGGFEISRHALVPQTGIRIPPRRELAGLSMKVIF